MCICWSIQWCLSEKWIDKTIFWFWQQKSWPTNQPHQLINTNQRSVHFRCTLIYLHGCSCNAGQYLEDGWELPWTGKDYSQRGEDLMKWCGWGFFGGIILFLGQVEGSFLYWGFISVHFCWWFFIDSLVDGDGVIFFFYGKKKVQEIGKTGAYPQNKQMHWISLLDGARMTRKGKSINPKCSVYGMLHVGSNLGSYVPMYIYIHCMICMFIHAFPLITPTLQGLL